MANLDVAAADPIFYTHHANIDRMWWHWSQHYQNFLQTMPRVKEWQERCFTFYGPDGKPVVVQVGGLQDIEKLGYGYSTPNVDLGDWRDSKINDLLNMGVQLKEFLFAFASWLPEQSRRVIFPDIQSLRSGFSLNPLTWVRALLNGSVNSISHLSSEMAKVLEHSTSEMPVQLTIPAGAIQFSSAPYYGVALSDGSDADNPVLIGTFALLAHHDESSTVSMGGCIGLKAVQLILSTRAGSTTTGLGTTEYGRRWNLVGYTADKWSCVDDFSENMIGDRQATIEKPRRFTRARSYFPEKSLQTAGPSSFLWLRSSSYPVSFLPGKRSPNPINPIEYPSIPAST